jgi:hypothetical protein
MCDYSLVMLAPVERQPTVEVHDSSFVGTLAPFLVPKLEGRFLPILDPGKTFDERLH